MQYFEFCQPSLTDNYAFDVMFSVMGVHQLVVCYWRGLWGMMDLHLHPENKFHSMFASFAIGYSLLAFLCIIQPSFNAIYRHYLSGNAFEEFWKWSLEVATFFVSNVVNVAVWRGVWLFCDLYALPDHLDLICGVTSICGLGILMLTLCGHSVTVRGCDIDGDSPDDTVCFCPNRYVRYFRQSHPYALSNDIRDKLGQRSIL